MFLIFQLEFNLSKGIDMITLVAPLMEATFSHNQIEQKANYILLDLDDWIFQLIAY